MLCWDSPGALLCFRRTDGILNHRSPLVYSLICSGKKKCSMIWFYLIDSTSNLHRFIPLFCFLIAVKVTSSINWKCRQVLFFFPEILGSYFSSPALCSPGQGGCKWQFSVGEQKWELSLVIPETGCSWCTEGHGTHFLLPVLGKSLKSSIRDTFGWKISEQGVKWKK